MVIGRGGYGCGMQDGQRSFDTLKVLMILKVSLIIGVYGAV
jgi:hypothetical protein